LDFGAGGSNLTLPSEIVRELKIPMTGAVEITGYNGAREIQQTGGTVAVKLGKAEAELGVSQGSEGGYVLIPERFFHLYRLTIDYPNRMLYIEKRITVGKSERKFPLGEEF